MQRRGIQQSRGAWFSPSLLYAEGHGLLLSKLARYLAGRTLTRTLSAEVLRDLLSLSTLFYFGTAPPKLTNIQLSRSQAPRAMRANFWKPFSHTLKFSAGMAADSLPFPLTDSVVKSNWIPCSLPPPWPISESLQGLFLPLHPRGSRSTIALHYFQVRASLLHTEHPPNSDLQRHSAFTFHQAPSRALHPCSADLPVVIYLFHVCLPLSLCCISPISPSNYAEITISTVYGWLGRDGGGMDKCQWLLAVTAGRRVWAQETERTVTSAPPTPL